MLRSVPMDLPEPPYPADTKANGYNPEIDWQRIEQSRTWKLADSELRPWLLMLWLRCWKNIPCGSYENDEEMIAIDIGANVSFLRVHREELFRGWLLHSDGRFYHTYVTELVLRMLDRRLSARKRKQKQREASSGESGNVTTSHTGVTRDKTGVTRESQTEQEQETGNRKGKKENPPTEGKRKAAASAKPSASPTGSRLPLTELPDDWRAFCQTERPDLDPRKTWETFHDYWVAQPGVKGRKTDWLATWRNWVRKQDTTRNGGIGNGRTSTRPLNSSERARIAREQLDAERAAQRVPTVVSAEAGSELRGPVHEQGRHQGQAGRVGVTVDAEFQREDAEPDS